MSVVDEADQDERHEYIDAVTASLDVPTRRPYVLIGHHPEECIANAGEAEGSLIVMTSHARVVRHTHCSGVSQRTSYAPSRGRCS